MKKIMFLLVAAMLSTMLFAQDRKMSELKVNQLPKEVTDFIKKNMPGSTITRAGKIDEKGVISYVTVLERKGTKHAYRFDNEGKLIGKADNILKTSAGSMKTAPSNATTDPSQAAPAAKPPIRTKQVKPATKTAADDGAVPKK